MYIMTKEGRIVEGEVLTEEQLFEIHELPKILGDYPYLYISESDKKRLAKYLVEKLEMRKKPEPVVEEEIYIPDPPIEEVVYPAPGPPSDDPMF